MDDLHNTTFWPDEPFYSDRSDDEDSDGPDELPCKKCRRLREICPRCREKLQWKLDRGCIDTDYIKTLKQSLAVTPPKPKAVNQRSVAPPQRTSPRVQHMHIIQYEDQYDDYEAEFYLPRRRQVRPQRQRRDSVPKLTLIGPTFLDSYPQIPHIQAIYWQLQYHTHPYPPLDLRLPYVSFTGFSQVIYRKAYTLGTGHVRGLSSMPDLKGQTAWPVVCRMLARSEADLDRVMYRMLGTALAMCVAWLRGGGIRTLLGLGVCLWPAELGMLVEKMAMGTWALMRRWTRDETGKRWEEEVD